MNKNAMLAVVIGVLVLVGGGVWMSKSKTSVTGIEEKNMGEKAKEEMMVEETDQMAEAEAEVRTVVVEGNKFRFNPAEIRMKKGETVKILFKSVDMLHDFVIDEFELATDQIGAGEEEEVEFVADKAGTFEYYCSVGSHRKMGMVGSLIVE